MKQTGQPIPNPLRTVPFCIGLTGGIGCGKSTVARLFAAQGACIIDTDAIAHQLTQPGGVAIPTIQAAFGAAFITPAGMLNRSKMRQLIFSDANAKRSLEAILHPLILETSKAALANCTHAPYAILMAPLLLESPPFLQLVQRVLLVECSEEQQIIRVMQRSQLDESEIRAIIAQQISPAERIAQADDILINNGSLGSLENHVFALHGKYMTMNKPISI